MKQIVAGVELDQRDGALPSLLCLHGIGGDTSSFEPQLKYFEGKQKICAWNMPGYGNSEPLSSTSFKSLAEKVATVLKAQQLTQVVLVGQSIGGMIALEVAVRFPELVSALVLVGTTPSFGGRDDTFKSQFIKARLAPLEAGKSMRDLAPDFVPQIVGSIATPEVKAQAVASMSAVPTKSYRNIIECLVTFNRREALAQLLIPCLVIAGEEDKNAPARTMEKMAKALPNARYHCVEQAGHLINLEAGDICNRLIEDFLGELQ